MNVHPIITPASPSLASPIFDASFDSIESLPTSFAGAVDPTLETTTVTEVALGYHRNGQYSLTAMTTSTGVVADRYAYTAYGQPTILNASGSVLTSSAVGNRYTYAGREWDETLGLHHFRARWMSPLAGRFLSRDPIGYVDGSGLYCFNGRLSLVDPLGNDARQTFFDPTWIGTSGCFEYCVAAGYSTSDCQYFCNHNSLPDDWPGRPNPDRPICWGQESDGMLWPLPNVELQVGNESCNCEFGVLCSYERPKGTLGNVSTPGRGDSICRLGEKRVMQYKGVCKSTGRNS